MAEDPVSRYASMRVSHETIYHSLFIQARGVLKKELMGTCDPSAASADRGTLVSLKTGAVKSRGHLHSRKACGSGGPRHSGHWEGDLLRG